MAILQEARPTYRHTVVTRKGFVEKVATPEQFRRLRRFLDQNLPVPAELQHLVKGLFSKEQIEATFGAENIEWGVSFDAVDVSQLADELQARRSAGDTTPIKVRPPLSGAVVVGRVTRVHVPGGVDRLPSNPTVLQRPGFTTSDDPAMDFMRLADLLQEEFRLFSDRRFLLADPWTRQNCTLVTVVYTPIMALPKLETGLDVFCEFHQVTRMGKVDALADGFEVISEIGEFPVKPPGPIEMATMMKSAEAVLSEGALHSNR